jgi:hypothetical protein
MEKGLDILFFECTEPVWAGSFTAAARELARYKLELVGVQVVCW